METLSRFFWFCSGVHQDTLKKYPTEHQKYVGIGATIFFTALFAALSGGYAMYFVFKGDTMSVIFAFCFGLLWGLAIFNMDRYIVSSINKSGNVLQQTLQALPRIILAIMIGLVISRPLELKIFDKEIRERLKVSYLNKQRSKIDTLQKTFQKKYELEFRQLQQNAALRDSLSASIQEDRRKLNYEVFGTKTNETSGQMGYGPYAKRKESALQEREQELQAAQSAVQQGQAFIADRQHFDGLRAEKLSTGRELDSLVGLSGFADRNWALGQLSVNTDGTKDTQTATAVTFIGLLFIFFECLPVFVKLMSTTGLYDKAVKNMEDSLAYQSDKTKEFEIAVTDGVQQTKIERGIEQKKQFWNDQNTPASNFMEDPEV